MKKPVITIDGPAGSGKTTVSQRIAKVYRLIWVDTGALYRGVALISKQSGVASDDLKGLEQLCQSLRLTFVRKGERLLLYNHETDISDAIRTPEISMLASSVSAQPVVRQYLLDVQRQLGKQGAVLEGRDMGTVVFPNADIKFFLFADHTVRAKRRFKELQEKSIDASFEKLSNEIKQRDLQDQNRDVAPLKPAEDAIHIDCSDMGIDEVVIKMQKEIDRKFPLLNTL
ncbi:Cytidylate kinase [Candidatus Magnetomorum sp. HK-1]|nr:Cytidylate kinase [Candidatus Magnetomorum sp. HK-1]